MQYVLCPGHLNPEPAESHAWGLLMKHLTVL